MNAEEDWTVSKVKWTWSVLVVLLLPVWVADWLPTTDFTNHLARCWVLFKIPVDPYWSALYKPTDQIAPNMAIDLLAPLFYRFFSVELTGRLLFSLVIVLHWIGIRSLSRAAGTWGWLSLTATFLVQNSILYMGFFNYCFSLSLWLLVLAIWRQKENESWGVGTALALGALGSAVYISHLGGAFCLGVSAAWMAAWSWRVNGLSLRRLTLYFLPLWPSIVCYLIWPPPKPNPMPPIVWDGPQAKAIKLLGLFSGYDYAWDALVLVLFAAGLLLVWRLERPRFDGALLGLGLIFAFLYLSFPYSMASGSDAYTRFLPPAGFLICIAFASQSTRQPGWGAMLLLSAMGIKMVLLSMSWFHLGQTARSQLSLLDQAETHKHLLPLVYQPEGVQQQKRERFVQNLSTAAVYRKEVAVATVFSVTGQHALSPKTHDGLRPGVDDLLGWGRIPPEYHEHPELIDFNHVFRTFDYVYTWRMPAAIEERLRQYGELVGERDFGKLFRRKR